MQATVRERTHGTLTRKQAKERTRQRLLSAARRLILTEGEAQLSASAVAREAGVGGATFYEHFENKEDLLRALAVELFEGLRDDLREHRRDAVEAPGNEFKLGEQFRRPLRAIVASPELFRLALRVRHQLGSPLGHSSRQLNGSLRTDLFDELVDRGYPAATPLERRRLEMIADIHIAATEVLALGYINGRYPDLEEIVDMLILVTRGTRLVREESARPDTSARAG
jgi:AcrR family transcriptional regulator